MKNAYSTVNVQYQPTELAIDAVRRRMLLRGASTALGVSMLGAGLATPAHAMTRGKLNIWFGLDGQRPMRSIGARFTADTGVPVTVEAPDDGARKFTQAAGAGKGPDLWVFAHDRIGEWIAGGLLRPVTPNARLRDDIEPRAWEAFTMGGRIWGYPMTMESAALVYNRALVKTPPASFEDVLALDRSLSAQGKRAILWEYTNTYFTWPLLAAGGGYPFRRRADGSYDPKDSGVNNAGATAGATLLHQMVRDGMMPLGAGYPEMEAAMAKSQVAMMINGPWSWDNLEKVGIDFGVAPIPSVNGKPASPFVGVKGVMINRASPNRELAVEFIEQYLLTAQGLRTIHDNESLIVPASRSFYQTLSGDRHLDGAMAAVRVGQITPNNPEMGRFWSAMKTSLTNLTEGRQSVKDALDTAHKRIAQ